MARPITWQNVNGGSDRGAARMMESGTQSINDGFNLFNKLIQDTQQVRADNRNTRVDNNTQAFMDRLQSFGSPEELAAARESGEIQGMREGFGNMIDREATRGAGADRLQTLQQQTTAQNVFDDQTRQRAEREGVDGFRAMLASGEFDAAEEFLGSNDLMNDGALAGELASAREGAQDRNFQMGQRARTLEEQGRDDAFRESIAAARTAGADRKLRDKQTSDALVSAATGMGLPVVDGAVDFSNATPEQQAQLHAMVQEQDLLDRTSDTQYVNQTMAKLLEANPGMSPERELSLREMLVNETSQGSTLTPTDQATITAAREEAKELANISSNPFNTPQGSSDVEAADILASEDRFDDWNAGEREKATRQINKAMANGVKVGNKTMPVTPAIAKMALAVAGNAWFEIDDSFETVVKKLAKDQNLAEKYEQQLAWEKEDKAIQAAGTAELESKNKGKARQSRFQQFLDRDLSPRTPAQTRPDLPKPSNQNTTRPQRGGL